MCEHEGRPCPGRSCRCECMTCMFGEDDKTGLWECDGGDFVGTWEEVDAHVRSNGKLADGTLKDPQDIVCWGSMQVGGVAWTEFHTKGIHPMTVLMESVLRRYSADTEA